MSELDETETLLVELYRDQALQRAQQEHLAQRLREDAGFSRTFAAEARMQGALAALLASTDVDALLAGIARGLDTPAAAPGTSGNASLPPATALRTSPRGRSRPLPRRRVAGGTRLHVRTAVLLAATLAVMTLITLHLAKGQKPEHGEPVVAIPRPGPSVAAPAPALAWIRSSSGAVSILGAGATPSSGTALKAHEVLQTGADGHAEIGCADGTRLTAAPGSRISLSQDQGLQVQLDAGKVAGDIAKQPEGQPMVFTTPSALAIVVGTRLSLEVTPGGSRLEVDAGRVRFAAHGVPLAQATEIGAGQAGETTGATMALSALNTAPAPWAGAVEALIAAQAGEASWQTIPWMTDLGKARQQAASTGRLLVIWSGWGHPLGMAGEEALADRQTCWADPGIQKTLADHAIPVAVDAWFIRHEDDAVGRFYASLVQQSGHHGGTTQGIYCCDAQGALRGFCSSAQGVEQLRTTLAQALAQPIPVEDLPPDDPALRDRVHDPQPLGTDLILQVHERTLLPEGSGWRSARAELGPVRGGPSLEYLWVHQDQWQALIPATPHLLDVLSVPTAAVLGLAEDGLLDTTAGEETPWEPEDLQSSTLTITVDALSGALMRLRLGGEIRLASNQHRFAPTLSGMIVVDRASGVITSFDCVALGAFKQVAQDTPAPPEAVLALHITLAPAHAPVVHPHIAREGVRSDP